MLNVKTSRPRKGNVFVSTVLLVAAAILYRAPALQACECVRIGRACERASSSDAVFLGKVVKVSGWLERTVSGSFQQRRVTFQVAENFKGVADGTVEIVTGIGNGDCGFPF